MRSALLSVLFALAVAVVPVAAQEGQAAVAKPAAKQQRTLKSVEEQKALQAIMQATTPDARIAAGEEFVTKYPKSDFVGYALFLEAQGLMQKGENDKMVIYGERTLESNPDDTTKMQTMLMLGKELAQRTREFDLDREEKLTRADKYANGALETLKAAEKPNPNLSDEQWAAIKGQLAGEGHEILGMTALVRKNNDQAVSEFKTALDASKEPQPTVQVRLASAYNRTGKYDDAIALCDKLMADPNMNPAIKQVAQAERVRALQAKGGGAAPAAAAKPDAPATPAPAPTPKP